MNILFISYWNIDDPLTVATVYPSLKILQGLDEIKKIIFVNTERATFSPAFNPDYAVTKIIYRPLFSKNKKWRLFTKIFDFILFPAQLAEIVFSEKIDVAIARGAPAGALLYLLFKKTNTPFLVESFEPHADYMLESKVWSRFDLRYLFQRYWESQQKKYASGLLPVSTNFQKLLIQQSVDPKKIKVVPCGVNAKLFEFRTEHRQSIRRQLGISPNAMVGIYAGKYGGLYMAERSFELYRYFFNRLPDFNLIILSPLRYHAWIKEQIVKYELISDRIFVKSVEHHEVGKYCSASDFAFATYKPGKSKAYLSPVKIGEYWANGLPIFLTKGIGDESAIVDDGFGGVLFEPKRINLDYVSEKIDKLITLVNTPEIRSFISTDAVELRSFKKLELAYKYFLWHQ